jgi:hypothetical protein
VKTTFYIQFEGRRAYWNKSRIGSVHAKRLTTKRPDRPIANSVLVKLTVNLPEEAFLPLEPAVEIDIPIDRTEAIGVEVEGPDAPEEPGQE